MKRLLIVLMLLGYAVAGNVNQAYALAVDSTGNAVMGQATDLSLYAIVSSELPVTMAKACLQVDGVYSCGVANKKMVITRETAPSDNHYIYTVEYGIPYNTYTVVVTEVRNNEFTGALEKAMNQTPSIAQPINLNVNNSATADMLELLDVNVAYEFEMPGEVQSIKAGSLAGSVDGKKAKINLLEAMKQAQPIEVKSQEMNWSGIVVLLGILVVIALAGAVIFEKRKKPPVKPSVPPTSPAPKKKAKK